MPDRSDEVPGWMGDCETCRAIWNPIASVGCCHGFNLGSYKDALSTQCSNHKPLVQAFFDHNRMKFGSTESDTLELGEGFRDFTLRLSESSSHGSDSWKLLLLNKDSVPNHPGLGRILDSEWGDLELLNRWKRACLSIHGSRCENPLKIWHTRPAWLIDVDRKCLVPGGVDANYVALSYTYGNHIGALIDAETLQKLQLPYALENSDLQEYVPPIIRNATYLTSAIGERYLWADALCITHYDRNHTTEQLKLMAAIYANAIVTIIAADGDSLTGLTGLKGVSEPRQLKQKIVPFGDETIIVRNTGPADMEDGLPYYYRGWIYQEFKMSPRKILFNHKELHWICQCSIWHEELVPGAEVDREIDESLKVLVAGFPDDRALSRLVGDYNRLDFRYEEDALPAITGLLSVISRTFPGGFLYGIPEMLFERGLGWKPHEWDRLSLRRRLRSSRPKDIQLTPSGLPSWSWIGWSGWVSLEYNEAMRIPFHDTKVEETIPTAQWYTSHSPSDPPSKWRRIRSTWYENRDSYKDLSKPLPAGWTRNPVRQRWTDMPHVYPDGCEKYLYVHESMPITEDQYPPDYYCPFPVPDINESTIPDMPEQTPYLFCKTTKARLWGYKNETETDAELYNAEKKKIGFLNLVNKDSLTRFLKSEGEPGLPVDLVTVCKIRTYSQTKTEGAKIKVAGPQEEYADFRYEKKDTYLVLWVEWEDGIAYRLACGQVEVEEWDRLNLETISLILG
ncbi:hypothetical protein F53441_9692 [Fusarium austroafricanum]|uniref:Heterokaryon incompatibility domain-containing protein n=1 Tax=Fusarium austroafricanum TaxID=2364996 RepID=A0A8H4KB46_9HYPO|nr:hypothetical protein F53441_9692 [Fusarium austroafricanum]